MRLLASSVLSIAMLPGLVLAQPRTATDKSARMAKSLAIRLTSKDVQVSARAEDALARLGPAYISVVRSVAPASTLVKMSDELARVAAVTRLTPQDREALARAGAYFRDHGGVGYLAPLLTAPTPGARIKAADLLASMTMADRATKLPVVQQLVAALKTPPPMDESDEDHTIDQICKCRQLDLLNKVLVASLPTPTRDNMFLIREEDINAAITLAEKWLRQKH